MGVAQLEDSNPTQANKDERLHFNKANNRGKRDWTTQIFSGRGGKEHQLRWRGRPKRTSEMPCSECGAVVVNKAIATTIARISGIRREGGRCVGGRKRRRGGSGTTHHSAAMYAQCSTRFSVSSLIHLGRNTATLLTASPPIPSSLPHNIPLSFRTTHRIQQTYHLAIVIVRAVKGQKIDEVFALHFKIKVHFNGKDENLDGDRRLRA